MDTAVKVVFWGMLIVLIGWSTWTTFTALCGDDFDESPYDDDLEEARAVHLDELGEDASGTPAQPDAETQPASGTRAA